MSHWEHLANWVGKITGLALLSGRGWAEWQVGEPEGASTKGGTGIVLGHCLLCPAHNGFHLSLC